jgi:hypothetical protein
VFFNPTVVAVTDVPPFGPDIVAEVNNPRIKLSLGKLLRKKTHQGLGGI